MSDSVHINTVPYLEKARIISAFNKSKTDSWKMKTIEGTLRKSKHPTYSFTHFVCLFFWKRLACQFIHRAEPADQIIIWLVKWVLISYFNNQLNQKWLLHCEKCVAFLVIMWCLVEYLEVLNCGQTKKAIWTPSALALQLWRALLL